MEWNGPPGYEHRQPYTGKHREVYLPTVPGTQIQFTTDKPGCAGHPWRWRRGLGWLHRAGHRARLLRNELPQPAARGYVS